MKGAILKRSCVLLVGLLILLSFPCAGQELQPLNEEWLANDFKSMELISLLASPAPLTAQKIIDILDVPDKDGAEEDLGFDATRFNVAKGHGYTSLTVEAFVLKGTIGFYKLELHASPDTWPRIRERMIELWKQNNGPTFEEAASGIVHTECDESILRKYRAAVSAQLGEMNAVQVPAELKKSFDSLTQPMEIDCVGGSDGETAIAALVKAERFDLLENVLRGFNPNGRIYAAMELLRLSKEGRLVLSADILAVIATIRNLDIEITRVRGCIVFRTSAKNILDVHEQ